MHRLKHSSILTETIQARVIILCIVLILLGLGLSVLIFKSNFIKFHEAYNAVYFGQDVSAVHHILKKKGLSISSESSAFLEASTSVGFDSDLVMTIKIDELGRVAEKNAFDTGFNMILF